MAQIKIKKNWVNNQKQNTRGSHAWFFFGLVWFHN